MELISDTLVRSASCGEEPREIGMESLQFREELERLMEAAPQEAGSSFTALLELPPNQAMELLHSPETQKPPPPKFHGDVWSNGPQIDHQSAYPLQSLDFPPTFPSNTALLERASRFSVFAAAEKPNSVPSISSPNSLQVKPEPVDSDSNPNSSSPIVPNNKQKSAKRKERETKGKCSSKKSKSSGNGTDGEQLPYVHVRARRGQATDSHSLAERARREKINARMKLLQDLVPGCNKISGTAMVLDEIINHVQSLQRQVEFLSMRLAAVNPRTDFNLDSLLAAESGSPVDSNFSGMVMPLVWPEEGQANGNRQHYQQQLWHFNALHQQPVWTRQENSHLIGPENTLISYDSSTNSAILHPDQIKMEI